MGERRAPATFPPTVLPNQNQASTSTRARPAIVQHGHVSPAAFPPVPTVSSNPAQVSTPTRTRSAFEQQHYVRRNSAYPPTTFSNQNHASTFTKARPANEKQRRLLPAPPLQPELSPGIVGGRRATAAYPPPTVSPSQNRPSTFTNVRPANEAQRQPSSAPDVQLKPSSDIVSGRRAPGPFPPTVSSTQNQESTPTRARPDVEQNKILNTQKAIEAEQRIRAEIKAVLADEKRAEAIAAEREKIEVEKRVQAQRDAVERNRAALQVREQVNAASRNPSILTTGRDEAAATLEEHENRARASRGERRPRIETNALLAERNRTARLAAAREDMQRRHEAEQRVRAQWEAIERNRAALAAARSQAHETSQNPPTASANTNRAAAASAERENLEGISEVDQRIRAQREAIERNRALLAARAQARTTSQNPSVVLANANSAAPTPAERENVELVPAAEQRMQAQRNVMEWGIAVLAAYEQARTTYSNPQISVTDVNRAAALLAARDEAFAAARDSLQSSPAPSSERAPFSQTLDFPSDTPTNTTTSTSRQHSAIDQQRSRAPRSRAELLKITRRDPEYLELTDREKYLRKLAMNREGAIRKRKRQREQRLRGD